MIEISGQEMEAEVFEIRVSEELDVYGAPKLKKAAFQIDGEEGEVPIQEIVQRFETVTFDLSGLTLLDTVGIGVLLMLAQARSKAQMPKIIVIASHRVEMTLEEANAEDYFQIKRSER